jgi:protein-disulfide isomerase
MSRLTLPVDPARDHIRGSFDAPVILVEYGDYQCPALDADSLLEYADAMGLDIDAFARDLTERRFADRVREDFLSGVRSGVNGTPSFFINGVRHDGGLDALRDAFELAAAAKAR